MTSYKVYSGKSKYNTYVYEYWDDIHMKTYLVYAAYNGGDVEEFLHKNLTIEIWFNYDNQLSLF